MRTHVTLKIVIDNNTVFSMDSHRMAYIGQILGGRPGISEQWISCLGSPAILHRDATVDVTYLVSECGSECPVERVE